jgi:hypothetical protein
MQLLLLILIYRILGGRIWVGWLTIDPQTLGLDHVNDDHWFKFDNESYAQEVMFISLFHLGHT